MSLQSRVNGWSWTGQASSLPSQLKLASLVYLAQHVKRPLSLSRACRYRSKGVLLGKIRPKIKWADVEAVKAELQAQLDSRLGGIKEEDLQEPEKRKKKKVYHPFNHL